jgi:hypothetical protein
MLVDDTVAPVEEADANCAGSGVLRDCVSGKVHCVCGQWLWGYMVTTDLAWTPRHLQPVQEEHPRG